MNIIMITENDPAGMGIAFTKAINKHTPHYCRLITTKTRYNFEFEKDFHVPDLGQGGLDQIVDLLGRADIIHFHILADEMMQLGPIRVKDFVGGKTLIHHHHGHPDLRSNPQRYRDKYKKLARKILVSTPDLLKLLPEAVWQPNLVDIEDSLLKPQALCNNGLLRIGQAVTRKDLKDTDLLREVVHRFNHRYPTPLLDLDIIEHTDYRVCLRRKRECDIVFDHMQGYFGVSSLESLSQGKPVIAGLDEWNLRSIKTFFRSDTVPWVIARNKEMLSKRLTELLDPAVRCEIGVAARKFMETCWSDGRVVENLIHLYESSNG